MAYNEAALLPLWRAYYGQAFGDANLFVLDNGSDDGGADHLGGAQVLRVPRGRYHDDNLKAVFVSRCQAALLAYYDVVVFADADEFLVPDPARFHGLADFIERRCVRLVNPIGLDLYHVPDLEPEIDLARPILAQRSYVRFAFPYCKPAISRIPLRWDPGAHTCDHPPSIDRDLFLFHLKRMDLALALRRLRTSRAIRWSGNAIAKGHGQDHRLEDQEFVRRLFPYSAGNIRSQLIDGFDFSRDLAQVPTERAHQYSDYEGSVARIPARFGQLIGGAAASPPRAAPGAGAQARRALRRLIAVNTVRDRCRPLAEQVRQWLAPAGRGASAGAAGAGTD